MKADRWTLLPVEPSGTKRTFAHVNYGPRSRKTGFQHIDLPVYPREDGDRLRKHRVERCWLGLRKAAAILGLSAVDLSSLERGSKRFASADEIERALAVLTEHAEPPMLRCPCDAPPCDFHGFVEALEGWGDDSAAPSVASETSTEVRTISAEQERAFALAVARTLSTADLRAILAERGEP